MREIEDEVGDAHDFDLETRIVEIPVLYGDPWTHETLMRFRDRHQDPDATDLEYAARINDFDDVQAFVDAHSGAPWLASMVGFVAGLPFLYQLVDARAPARGAQVRPPAHRHAAADRRPRRLLRLHLLRPRRGRLPDVRHHARRRSTTRARSCPTSRDFVCFFEPG